MYIEGEIFQNYGINNFSLCKQVSMRKRKNLKKRKGPVNYEGRRYRDYLEFVKRKSYYSNNSNGYSLQSSRWCIYSNIYFLKTGLMIGFLHIEKTSESMASTLDNLQKTLKNDYQKLFSLLLTDRGSEFEKYELFEVNKEAGEIRSNIFYCDPQTPSQKPHVKKYYSKWKIFIRFNTRRYKFNIFSY